MAYIINMRHSIAGETFNVKLHYNDPSSSNEDISIDLTSTYTDYTLTGWTNVDANKIQVINSDNQTQFSIDKGAVIYNFKPGNTHIVNQS